MSQKTKDFRAEIDLRVAQIDREITTHVRDGGRLGVVQAPPGSGKTSLLLSTISRIAGDKRRIAVATQTNSQANDICRRFALHYPKVGVVRFASKDSPVEQFGPSVSWATSTRQLPTGPSVVVATTAKWGAIEVLSPYDVLFVEEAWQLSWAEFMTLAPVSERFVLVGDPGQIPPVVTIDTARWETAPRRPHQSAPAAILASDHKRELWKLPATRRLPGDAAELLQPFYDFEFGAYATAGERAILTAKASMSEYDRTIDLLKNGSAVGLSIPTPDDGPPLEVDDVLAKAAATFAVRVLERGAKVAGLGPKPRDLTPRDIGLVATHRTMNSRMDLSLPSTLRGEVKIDTPERWQGLERPLMIVVHPLSGVLRPSAFDLETGRLCVMASRHQVGMVVLTRDHLPDTLASHINAADQAIGRPDIAGRGLHDNLSFWTKLESRGVVIAA